MADEDRLPVALGKLQAEVRLLSERFEKLEESTRDEHRKVHDIVVATSEAVRILTRLVDEMKPLTDDYREKRAEQRGEDRYKNWLYGIAASAGGTIVFLLGKIWDYVTKAGLP